MHATESILCEKSRRLWGVYKFWHLFCQHINTLKDAQKNISMSLYRRLTRTFWRSGAPLGLKRNVFHPFDLLKPHCVTLTNVNICCKLSRLSNFPRVVYNFESITVLGLKVKSHFVVFQPQLWLLNIVIRKHKKVAGIALVRECPCSLECKSAILFNAQNWATASFEFLWKRLARFLQLGYENLQEVLNEFQMYFCCTLAS